MTSTHLGPAGSDAAIDNGHDRFQNLDFLVTVCTSTVQGGRVGVHASIPPSSPSGAVPEPGSMALAGLAAAPLLGARRRSVSH